MRYVKKRKPRRIRTVLDVTTIRKYGTRAGHVARARTSLNAVYAGARVNVLLILRRTFVSTTIVRPFVLATRDGRTFFF